ncbi:hypothetical protein BDA99DRAFT_519755 [Phascolomyces articulosus]|uniref:Zn(2)-C6 fungal-type domain-containing protein n=1 Tax=Phascolomyces articulosus TaxID=60185 RepID=A0AAD5K394_9FUNG|nr:hypothetical protein BDA99DRAFT_519755 [Phascolomyces articulosus]
MRNDTPCSNCRIRRRKCVWQPNSNICERCAKIHLECIPIDDPNLSDNEAENEYKLARLQYWQNQVAQLEAEMQKLGQAIRESSSQQQLQLKQQPIPLTFHINNDTDVSHDIKYSSLSSPCAEASPSSSASYFSESSGISSTTSADDQQQPEWTLSVIDGHLRLETNITNLQELFNYSQASLRYLSPFTGLFQQERVYFETKSASIALAPFRLLSRSVAGKPRKRLALTYEPLSYNYRTIIHKLVMEYVHRANINIGLIHVPTFLTHYRTLKDPMTCPLTLGICVDASISPRVHSDMTSYERRNIAEIFFLKCKDMIYDMTDEDPAKKLQIVMAISFLLQYLGDGLLQYDESRRMATIGYLICKDIEPVYMDDSQAPLVARIMFQRHYVHHQAVIRLCDAVLGDKVDYRLPAIDLEVAPDEPLVTRKYITVYNNMLRFASSSFSNTLMQQINANVHGVPGELSLDMILQFEPVARQWWASLPGELRSCEDPYSDEVFDTIENLQEPTQTLVIVFIHVLSTIFHACMLHPRHLNDDSAATKDVLEAIREKALKTSVRSSEIMIIALRRNLELENESLPLPFDFLMQLLHSLCKVTSSFDVQFQPRVQSAFHKCFTIINSFLPPGHHVPASSSVLEVFVKTRQRSPLRFYEEYPLPGYALVADIFGTSLGRLRKHFHTIT